MAFGYASGSTLGASDSPAVLLRLYLALWALYLPGIPIFINPG
jgi:hypothetical protein